MNQIEEEFLRSLKSLLIRYSVELDAELLGTSFIWYFSNKKERGDESIFLTLDKIAYEISK